MTAEFDRNQGAIDLAEQLFPDNELTIEQIEARYPERVVPEGAMVTRIAPSPTGFMHIGGLYTALISERLAHQSGGTFFLRIEDTDRKREVEGAVDLIVNSLAEQGIIPDEGEVRPGEEVGEYGPYRQSNREQIYKAYVKQLVATGMAYPCFATPEELEAARQTQTAQKVRPGYYGQWATWRDAPVEEASKKIAAGERYVIRLKSPGDYNNRVSTQDLLKGQVTTPENDQDVVILKGDGLPTYHFAHVVDDHFMGTTHVIRGDEWLASLPLHQQLFSVLGWEAPNYGHISPIEKMEGKSRRKLSKRKDPEASVQYYTEQGFPREAILGYLLNLANPGYEEWVQQNPKADPLDYPFELSQLQRGSGALLDLDKMAYFSKQHIATLEAAQVYDRTLRWASQFRPEFAAVLSSNSEYTLRILNIEKSATNQRKDIVKWEDLPNANGYFYDEIFNQTPIDMTQLSEYTPDEIRRIGTSVAQHYEDLPDNDTWMAHMRVLAAEHGYAPDNKTYKAAPGSYKGQFGSFVKVVRVLLSGRNQTPNLFEVMQVMGKERVTRRLMPEV